MLRPTVDEIRKLATEGSLIPVVLEIPADLETPASVYLKLKRHGPSFLFESVERGEQVGRYSFLGVDPIGVLTARDGRVSWSEGGTTVDITPPNGDPLIALEGILARYRPVTNPALPDFYGGLVGYLGYDAVRFFERAPLPDDPGLDLPDAVFLLSDVVVVFDHVKRQLMMIANVHVDGDIDTSYADAARKIDALISALGQPLPTTPSSLEHELPSEASWRSNVEQPEFEEAVRTAKQHIVAGEIFQGVLSQRLSRETSVDPFAVYRALRMLNPSPYMFYLDLPGALRIVGSSPETMVRLNGSQAELRPIAGTRHRGATRTEDKALAEELLADPKERAEHVMLVDLGRNDLGRVCRYGTVSTEELMSIEAYSHVMHIVSSVRGELRPEKTAFDLLRATFPAGTVSGAPKVRAMDIVAELEKERRGPYAGAVGYFSFSGAMDTCIAIRTLVMHGETVHVQAGAGIVADSDPSREYEETLNKAKALAEAVRRAECNGTATGRGGPQ